ncbi:MAG TPA: PIG-L family deacetylase [Candidatus Acidoferrum sp.]|nr:PIG-L family deacetylase [Candidatus Acidoferrum sp.]
MRNIVVVGAVALSLMGSRCYAQFPAAPGTGPGLAETIEAIDSARVTTRILYVTAHPDDERADVLTYLARGLHADVALLSLTRGEGGQNALGPEQAPQLGLIRTQELLAATRGYGVKLYFTRAKDFGFSKTPEETEKVWGDQVLEDMVRVIRTFRPNIVINNWGGVHGGHGHHQAAGRLTPIAVTRAADANAYPAQFKEGLTAWGGEKNEVVILDVERFTEKPTGYVLPLDDVSPLWGKSWREIGLDAFANHKTQGISVFYGNPFFRRPIALKREDGKELDPKILARKLASYADTTGCAENDCKPFDRADGFLDAARNEALILEWGKALTLVEAAETEIEHLLPGDARHSRESNEEIRKLAAKVQARIIDAKLLVKGVQVSASATTSNVVVGEHLDVKVSTKCRISPGCASAGFFLVPVGIAVEEKSKLPESTEDFDVVVQHSQPQTLSLEQLDGGFALAAQLSEGGSPGSGKEMFKQFPVEHVDATSTHLERVPVRIVPAYTLAVEPEQEIEKLAAKHEPFNVFLRVHSYSQKTAKVTVGLDVPEGWKTSGTEELSFAGEGDRYAKITLVPPAKLAEGNYSIVAYAKHGEEKFTTSIEPLPSMPALTWEEPAQTVVHAFDIKVPENLRVGYISAESEPVPDSLKMLGIHVEMLDANSLNFGDLSKYDAILVGVRAYELRSELPGANQRLLDYAKNGGTLVVQYQRDFAWDGKNFAPYPAKIANKQGDPLPRITDETSPVKFLKPDDPLLNTPNKITQEDFKAWVQERGLYFWSEFDPQYTALLAMHDPGEKDLNGALVYAKYGKGTYIYTGIAFFRQLPEGVPGAYRLFVNLLAASRPR